MRKIFLSVLVLAFIFGCVHKERFPSAANSFSSSDAPDHGSSINFSFGPPQGGYWVSDWQEVNIPENLLSFQVQLFGSMNSTIQVTDLVDPDGYQYVYSTPNPSGEINSYTIPMLRNVLSPNRSEGVANGFGSLIVPNHPNLPAPKAGNWKMRLLSYYEPAQKSAQAMILPKFKKAAYKNEFEIRVWVSSEKFWQDPEHIKKLILRAQELFAEAGLKMNVLSVQNLEKSPTAPLELPQDLTAIALAHNDPQTINMYLMGSMTSQDKPINGLACLGGLIETSRPHGCFTGMFASKNADTINLDSQAKIFVHEVSHYLGLFHTVDNGYMKVGQVTDSLEDTPKDVKGKNMMDPGIHNEHPTFSPLQLQMLRVTPAVH